ncbi:hypothetical protein DERP_004028 [Dermatophagoides pteronyssinus]|uniref:Uncharacterized protein n=1 Tax=Dermatophagoides pteronyssinus TaxID=6956 RepID=A0ABQ8J7X8_DERPT|nr:hypothetical protein DERP_004028 [Dermatophagoides pteronyssinus]
MDRIATVYILLANSCSKCIICVDVNAVRKRLDELDDAVAVVVVVVVASVDDELGDFDDNDSFFKFDN